MKSYSIRALRCYFIVVVCVIWATFGLEEKAVVPKDDNALSLWLITRTGWVYCERAGVYMNAVEQRFNEVKCQKCYTDLFDKHKKQPNNVSDMEIVKCSKNFGASLVPVVPTFSSTENGSEENQKQTSTFGLFRQLNPLETMGVRAFTCNSEVSENRTLSLDQIGIPTVAAIFQLFSSQQFSPDNVDPKRKYPRKSYVDCLFGKLFETEVALCPINFSRRRCALQNRQADEEKIFSTKVPISYN